MEQDHWSIRHRAATLIANICTEYGKSYHTLQPRITKTLLRAFMDPARPLTTQYGAIIGLEHLSVEVSRVLILPNIKYYSESILLHALDSNSIQRKQDAEKCQNALVVSSFSFFLFLSIVSMAKKHNIILYMIACIGTCRTRCSK